MEKQVLYKCPTRHCAKFKFENDDEWEDATSKGVIKHFAEKVRAKVYTIKRVLCPDCADKLMKETPLV